jgi:hypothetical protein
MVTPHKMVALLPMDARFFISVGMQAQSSSDWSDPDIVVAFGYLSLINITPWPINTSSSIVTPSQMKEWLEILTRFPIHAPF